MASPITIPGSGELGGDIILHSWLVGEGDSVNPGDPVAEIEADKGVLEIEAVSSGLLLKKTVQEGTRVDQGEIIGYLGEEGENLPAGETAVKKTSVLKIIPAARRLALEKGIDTRIIHGTGPEGVITLEDVRGMDSAGKQIIPLSRNKKQAAEKLSRSVREIPAYLVQTRIDMTRLRDLHQHGYSYDALFLYFTARVLQDYPLLCSEFLGDSIGVPEKTALALAIDIQDELFLGVIREVSPKNLEEIENDVRMLAEKAAAGKLPPQDMSSCSFIISNLGMYDITSFEGILFPGTSSILALGAITDSAEAVNGSLEVRPICTVTLTIDHRLINGRYAAEFMTALKKTIESAEVLG